MQAAGPAHSAERHAGAATAPSRPALEGCLRRAVQALLARQAADGHWCFELEADCTIPAEYILLLHFMGETAPALEAKLAVYLRARQGADGGWPLYHGGAMDLSCTVKVYYALKLTGDDPEAAHMRRAREAILARGGAARSNVFTRIALAMFEQVPWRAVPYMPPEIMLLPRWFPFHLSKVAYWSRTVMVPLLVIYAFKPRAANPRGIDIRELFVRAPEVERGYFPARSRLNRALLVVERAARMLAEPLIPRALRERALAAAEDWFVERLNGEDGLGAIFPAMVNAYIALHLLGYLPQHPLRATARRAIDKLLVLREDDAYCQPCVSPVWDTGLIALALLAEGSEPAVAAARRGLDWLRERQVSDEAGDWRENHPDLPGGGWAFQYANPHYPDLDDTAAVAWAMDQYPERERYADCVVRAADWLAGMQSRNGGFAAFDSDNTCFYLNEIPFADHGALLDPPSADVSARVLALLGRLERPQDAPVLLRCLDYLKRDQEPSGAWFGRWGSNHVYGTWSVLSALQQAGMDMRQPFVRRAVDWIKGCQREDGGWGESNDSYAETRLAGRADHSTAHHTAWALLGLIAAGEAGSEAVDRGAAWLLTQVGPDGLWEEPWFNAPGFPRVFYLKYHGYARFFPLWALACYRQARSSA